MTEHEAALYSRFAMEVSRCLVGWNPLEESGAMEGMGVCVRPGSVVAARAAAVAGP